MSFEDSKNHFGARSLLNFEFIKDGTISDLSSSDLDVLTAKISEKFLMKNNIEYPNIDD